MLVPRLLGKFSMQRLSSIVRDLVRDGTLAAYPNAAEK
jgi:hypothetical protein